MNKAKRHEIFTRLKAANPEPTTELEYASPFELLIAVILSAQATDVSVNKATKALFKQANTPAAILALGEDGLKQYIKTIGLYNSKAKNIIKTCKILIDQGLVVKANYRFDGLKMLHLRLDYDRFMELWEANLGPSEEIPNDVRGKSVLNKGEERYLLGG